MGKRSSESHRRVGECCYGRPSVCLFTLLTTLLIRLSSCFCSTAKENKVLDFLKIRELKKQQRLRWQLDRRRRSTLLRCWKITLAGDRPRHYSHRKLGKCKTTLANSRLVLVSVAYCGFTVLGSIALYLGAYSNNTCININERVGIKCLCTSFESFLAHVHVKSSFCRIVVSNIQYAVTFRKILWLNGRMPSPYLL